MAVLERVVTASPSSRSGRRDRAGAASIAANPRRQTMEEKVERNRDAQGEQFRGKIPGRRAHVLEKESQCGTSQEGNDPRQAVVRLVVQVFRRVVSLPNEVEVGDEGSRPRWGRCAEDGDEVSEEDLVESERSQKRSQNSRQEHECFPVRGLAMGGGDGAGVEGVAVQFGVVGGPKGRRSGEAVRRRRRKGSCPASIPRS